MTHTRLTAIRDRSASVDAFNRRARIADIAVVTLAAHEDVAHLLELVDDLAAALRWTVNLGHDVGKAGGSPESGEFEAAMEAGKTALARLVEEQP